MRSLGLKALRILTSKNGETLFESIVSILVFTILIVTISMILLVSMGITGNANANARIMVNESNATLTGDDSIVLPEDGREINISSFDDELVFTFSYEEEGIDDLEIKVPTTVYESETYGFVAFEITPP